jgi:hypothetical protein
MSELNLHVLNSKLHDDEPTQHTRGVPLWLGVFQCTRVTLIGFLLIADQPVTWGQSNKAGVALEALLLKALSFVPEIERSQILVLNDLTHVIDFLVVRGYTHGIAAGTMQELRPLAEFTIDQRFPIFINATSTHVLRILRSWQYSKFPDQAARVMASDLYHEYLHAKHFADECVALQGQLRLLNSWRDKGMLTIAGPYIASRKAALTTLKSRGTCGSANVGPTSKQAKNE